MQRARNEPEHGNVYFGFDERPSYTVEVRWEKKGIFAVIITAHKFNTTAAQLKKNKGIGKLPASKITFDDLDEDRKKAILNSGIPIGGYLKALNAFVSSKKKK